MGWRFGACAKVAYCSDDALAKVPLPNAVDDYPSSQGVVLAGDFARELQTSTPVGEALFFTAAQQREKVSWNHGAAIVGFAAHQYGRVSGSGSIHKRHGSHWGSGVRQIKYRDFSPDGGNRVSKGDTERP